MKSYDKIRKEIKEQIKTKEISNPFTDEIMTLKDWKEINQKIRKDLKNMNVRCRSVFYNPLDEKIYNKQSFRNVKIDGLTQWTCTMEDFRLGTGKEPKGFYLDDEYFTIKSSRNINFLF